MHRVRFPVLLCAEVVEELSVDSGKVRLRTQRGIPSEWQDYKAVQLHGFGIAAAFQDNLTLNDWVKQQPLSAVVSSLGDGHPGIWNLVVTLAESRLEILDWFHLMENLHKVGGSAERRARIEAHLWTGEVDTAIQEFGEWSCHAVDNFKAYLRTHRHRIHNYAYLQAEGMSIGSGAMESAIKQMAKRIKISGA